MRINIRMVLVLLLVVALSAAGLIYFYSRRTVDYSFMFSYENTYTGGTWEIIKDGGFYGRETFIEEYTGQTGDALPDVFYEDGKTFVLCYGHTLEKLFYTEAHMSGRFTDVHPFYYANAWIKPADPELIYVYVIESEVSLDRDIHTNAGRDTKILK